MSTNDHESSSTHGYCSIPGGVIDRRTMTDNDADAMSSAIETSTVVLPVSSRSANERASDDGQHLSETTIVLQSDANPIESNFAHQTSDMSESTSNDQRTPNDTDNHIDHHDTNPIDEIFYVVHANGDTFSESYEVIYEIDPQCEQTLVHDDRTDNPCELDGSDALTMLTLSHLI
jgi:hypothetical protein